MERYRKELARELDVEDPADDNLYQQDAAMLDGISQSKANLRQCLASNVDAKLEL